MPANDSIVILQKYLNVSNNSNAIWFSSGETSAGKSSLLNLLLGEHLLPDHMLSCTSTICQIYNSVEKKAVAIDENGTKTFIKDLTKETLSEYVQIDRSKKCTHRYKTVEIY